MGIDGIGRGSGKPPASGIEQPSSSGSGAISEGPKGEFKVQKATATDAVTTSAPLEQLRSGAISISQYLDIKVDQATSHLAGRLGDEQLSFIRTSLREQLSTDPVLVDLVKSAAGALPPRDE